MSPPTKTDLYARITNHRGRSRSRNPVLGLSFAVLLPLGFALPLLLAVEFGLLFCALAVVLLLNQFV